MRALIAKVGPLASATATKVATAQRNYGVGGALALNGAASDAVSTSVCASQSPGSATLTINGKNAISGVAYTQGSGRVGQYIYITSGGDDHAITFAVVGTTFPNNIVVKETLTGTNAQSVGSKNRYMAILSIKPSGAVASTVTVGSYTNATLDTARRLLFTTTADESANVATITGTDVNGAVITENLTLTNNTTNYSVLDYLTVSTVTMSAAAAGNISVGTNAVASSPWLRLDSWAGPNASVQCTVVGTVSYTVQTSNDDPNSFTGSVTPQAMTWLSSLDTNVVTATVSESSYFQYPPVFTRVLLNSESGTGNVTMTVVQGGVAPY